MMTKDLEEEKSLRELLLALNEGLTVYRSLNKNYVPIKVSFSQCAYMTATTAIEELSAYIANLDRDICQEPLCLDLDEMGSEDYWMEKLSKLRSDMTELEEVPLLQRKLIWGYLGFYPWTTTEFYMGVEEKVMEVARLLRQVQQKMAEKPLSFYGKFYHDQRAQYCEEQAVKDFKYRLSHSGIPSLEKYKMFRAEEVIKFIKGDTLDCAGEPSVEEWEKVDINGFKKQVPLSCQEEEWFKKSFDKRFVIFSRTVRWEGDILVPKYDCAGLFIFQHWNELTEEQINAIFHLDKMLELIHEEIQQLPEAEADPAPACGHPAPERGGELEDRIKKCIALLMAERFGDEPLFNIQGHWQAVYRILVDKGYCRDSDFDGFDAFIQRVMPDKVNKPYTKASVKQISQTDFAKPFEEWKFDSQTSKTRRPYDRMVAIATRFKQILEENGL